MNQDQVLAQALTLDVDDRVVLASAIWESVLQESAKSKLTDAQITELDRRLADVRDHPEDCEPWEDVKQSLLAELRGNK